MASRYSLACFLIVLLTGCESGSDPNRPTTAPASGMVTYLGNPVSEAVVVFSPTTHKFAASAVTDQDGKFDLQAFPPESGAVPGSYTVMVLKASQEDVFQDQGKKPVMAKPRSLIPAKYSNPAQSGLVAEITEAGNNSMIFELKD
ncbi:carboxypeptidase-like regulatory domain-containing protein [Lacunimicrobium album]